MIEVEHVSRSFGSILAVDDVSFRIAAGEVVGFLGPNGAGKTTSLKMLSGLLHPTEGEGLVLGHVPARREKAFLRQITLVMGRHCHSRRAITRFETST